jgi:hypothetical protein
MGFKSFAICKAIFLLVGLMYILNLDKHNVCFLYVPLVTTATGVGYPGICNLVAVVWQ